MENTDKTKLWEYIKKLQGKEIKQINLQIYDTEGELLPEEEAEREIETFWKTIYQKQDNNICEAWKEEIR